MRLWLVFLCGLILLHCSSTPSRHPEAGFYAPKQPKFLIEMDDDGRKDGKEVWWYPNGQMKYESANRAIAGSAHRLGRRSRCRRRRGVGGNRAAAADFAEDVGHPRAADRGKLLAAGEAVREGGAAQGGRQDPGGQARPYPRGYLGR